MAETDDETLAAGYLVRLNGGAWGMAFGALCGLGLFVATAILLLKGGQEVGKNLSLLGNYLPGYDVSWLGAFLGLPYGFAIGYLSARIVCGVYNVTSRR